MELRQLRYFAAVSTTGTYTAAAELLHVAQPALWQQVKQLERELGLPLFERAGRRVRLTGHGLLLLDRVQQVLENVEVLKTLAADLASGRSGLIVVACSAPHVARFLGPVLRRFRERHPGVALQLHEHPPLPGGPADEVAAGSADVAFAGRVQGLEGFPVYSAEVVAAVPDGHPWAGRAELPVAELEGHPLLVSTPASLSRNLLIEACNAVGVHPRIEAESSNAATLVALGQCGLGIPVLADDALATVHAEPAPRLVGAHGPVWATVWLHWRGDVARSAALDAFIDEARRLAGASARPARKTS